MMKRWFIWAALILEALIYVGVVSMFDFPGIIALSVHFVRITISMTVLILYLPAINRVFIEIPPPGRDYLIVSLALNWMSGALFSFWNEMGRVFGTDTSIFSSPIAGFFSLMLLTSGIFLIIPEEVGGAKTKIIALLCGIIYAITLVIIIPTFR